MVKMGRFAPSVVLAILVCTIAAAVEHFVPPDAGLQINRAGASYGNTAIRTGPLKYPRDAVDSDAFTVRVARPALRIVSQYWSIDEYVYTVAPPNRVVAVSESAYLPNISNVYREVQKFRPAVATDPERVLRLAPDLLLVSNSSRADFAALVRSTQGPSYRVVPTFTTLSQVEPGMDWGWGGAGEGRGGDGGVDGGPCYSGNGSRPRRSHSRGRI